MTAGSNSLGTSNVGLSHAGRDASTSRKVVQGPALVPVISLDESTQSLSARHPQFPAAFDQNASPHQHSPSHSRMMQSYYVLEDASSVPLPSPSKYPTDQQYQDGVLVGDDPFLKFWDKVESLVEHFSKPLSRQSQPSVSYPQQTPIIPTGEDSSKSILQSYYMVPSSSQSSQRDPRLSLAPSPLRSTSTSAYGKYARPPLISSKTLTEYEIENKHLKEMVDAMSFKLNQMEKMGVENSMLKSSIVQFRDEFLARQV